MQFYANFFCLYFVTRRHEADNTEDLRLRVKRKDKAIEKAGSDTDESEASRLRGII